VPCERCGAEYEIGDYPFCKGRPSDHGPMRQAIQTDEAFIGGKVIENLGTEPVTVYSRTEFKQAMARAGVEQKIKYVPGDKHLLNWAAYTDAKTLENAAILVSRQGSGSKDNDRAALQSFRSSVRVVKKGE
jgi:hypothetical protein